MINTTRGNILTKKNLLILEDNIPLNQAIRAQLSSHFSIFQATTLQQTYAFLDQPVHFHTAVIDRMLPDGDGLEILAYLQKESPDTNLCVLSQCDKVTECLRGFEKGADVYLCKPLSLQYLKAQVLALQKRGRLHQGEEIIYRGLTLNQETHFLSRNSKDILLTTRENDVMTAFIHSSQGFLSKSQLYNLFWQLGCEPSDGQIHVLMQRLRKKLRQLQVTIQSQYGAGYQMVISSPME